MDTSTDPAVRATDAIARADAKFDAALERGDNDASDYWQQELMRLDMEFARAMPTTAAGTRLKAVTVSRILAQAERGDILTELGAELARLHSEAIAAAATTPRVVA